ncbi:MAG TPA: pyruvate kinase [Anaerolineales bacterium]|nr:pyruvate kinase [Anaerolineales bacterium]
MTRKAKIIATVGPASSSRTMLKRLLQAGVDVIRLNFSHGTYDDHAKVIKDLRSVAKKENKSLTILQDLQGPKLRTGMLENAEAVILSPGEKIILTSRDVVGTKDAIHVNYDSFAQDINEGDRILLDDGRIELLVTSIAGDDVSTKVIFGGKLGNKKGINLPGVNLSAPSLTTKDLQDIEFGLAHDVDAIALSFVRRAEDVISLREAISSSTHNIVPLLIAKLEKPEAIDNLDQILAVCDGVMVARGDLGVEVAPECVPSIQKHIIHRANAAQRFVITATQMLESMIENPRPSRAEASDVANAVFDGSDGLMLSGETAIGEYPIATVETMDRIIRDAESHALQWSCVLPDKDLTTDDDAVATTQAARALARDRDIAAVAVFTRSGRTARLMSYTRPTVPIVAFTPEVKTFHQLSLAWGVIPNLVIKANSVEEMIDIVRSACLASGIVNHGQQIVLVASLPIGAMGPPNFTLLHTIE